MKKYGILDKPNGEKVRVSPANGTDFSLKELQEMVGGFIEVIRLDRSSVMVVNEEGKLKGLPRNEEATFIYQLSGRNDFIVGNALTCPISMVK